MEYALPELSSREDILNILNQRHLHIHNINLLTHGELLRVYKTFVMPLTKRPDRSKRNVENYNVSTKQFEDYEEHCMQVEPLDNLSDAMDTDFTFMKNYNVEQLTKDRTSSPVGEKRRQRSSDEDVSNDFENDYQLQLSSVTKRIRINSL